jgi:hypothetical protein
MSAIWQAQRQNICPVAGTAGEKSLVALAWWYVVSFKLRRLRLVVGHATTVRPDHSTLGVVGDRGSPARPLAAVPMRGAGCGHRWARNR